MSKSFGNAIFLEADPQDMFGQVMSVPDDHILPYFTLLTSVPMADIEGMELQLKAGTNPRDLKVRLATEIVSSFHGPKAAKKAADTFAAVFQNKEQPEEMSEFAVSSAMNILDVLVAAKLATSRSEGKQLIAGGGVKLGDAVVTDANLSVNPAQLPAVLQKGKRHFVRLVP
jgi:tyrosyl-tRNA synthetase